MQINCGIVGLPNVGKSTLFSALSSKVAEAENYPFCTIEPNVGVVEIPDERLYKIADLIKTKKIIPAVMEFVDIAGLVKGASKGEGLGNKFLGHIREVAAIVNVVRCFDDDNVIHINKKIDPVSDIETVEIELALADLSTVSKRVEGLQKQMKSQDKKIANKAKFLKPILENLEKVLSDGKLANTINFNEKEKEALFDLHLLTMKKQFYCCNVDEASIKKENDYVKAVRKYLKNRDAEIIVVCSKIEAEIANLESVEEKKEFLLDLGLNESALNKLVRKAYNILNLKIFFTAGPNEVRAWTFKNGFNAKECAGIIHSDFARGFIKAECYHCNLLFEFGTEQKIKDEGLLKFEGRDYAVKDGDVLFFKFNV